jgi:hypothetical protein
MLDTETNSTIEHGEAITPVLVSSHNAGIFGGVPFAPEDIMRVVRQNTTKDVVKSFCTTSETPSGNNRPWKEAIFRGLQGRLSEQCKGHGHAEFTTAKEAKSEFMLDFVWLNEVNDSYRGALLGCECEWARNWKQGAYEEVRHDFRKLLHFKAPVKLFIYDCPDDDRARIREMLCSHLQSFEQHVKGECYIFVEFYGKCPKDKAEPWPQEAWQFPVGEDGKLSTTVTFPRIG